MNKFLLLVLALAGAGSCTSAQEEKKVEQAVEQKMLSDQEKLDSAEAAINKQLESVSDDSIMKSME